MGMIPLALVYQTLARQKPELEGGIYSYARAGFGEYIGFNSAWGYWLAGILGNVATIMLLFSTLGYFFQFSKEEIMLRLSLGHHFYYGHFIFNFIWNS